MTDFDYEKTVRDCTKVRSFKPAISFTVEVNIPKIVIEKQKEIVKERTWQTLDERLVEVAENWAAKAIRLQYPNMFVTTPRVFGKIRNRYEDYWSFEVAVLYSWG